MIRSSRLWRPCLKILVTVGLLGWVIRQIDLVKLWAAIVQAQWIYLVPIWSLAVLSYWLLSWKLALIMERQGCRLPTMTLFAISAVTTLYGMALPGPLDLSAKWYMLRQKTGKGIDVLSSMVYNQFTTTIVVVICGMIAILSVTPPKHLVIWTLGLVAIVVLILAGLLVLHGSYGPRCTNALRILLRPMPKVIAKHGQDLVQRLAGFQSAGWCFHLNALVLSLLANVGIGTLIYLLAARAAGISVPLGIYFWQSTAIFILGRLPISIAEFGIREATLVGSMARYGIEPSRALVMSMVILTNRLLLAAVGAGVHLFWGYRRVTP